MVIIMTGCSTEEMSEEYKIYNNYINELKENNEASEINNYLVNIELEKITEIEIIKNTSERGKKVTGKEEISKIISELKDNSESTKKESVSDEPTNTEDYICIKFYHDNADDSPSIVYLYKDKDDSFIEQPYSGIWKLKNEIFDNISENLIE